MALLSHSEGLNFVALLKIKEPDTFRSPGRMSYTGLIFLKCLQSEIPVSCSVYHFYSACSLSKLPVDSHNCLN